VAAIIGKKQKSLAKGRKRRTVPALFYASSHGGLRQGQKGAWVMFGKIALEEHWESPDFNAAGVHNFTNPEYFDAVQSRLENIDLRIEDMDRNGIELHIISLTQPGIEGIPDAAKAVYIAKTMNDYAATKLLAKYPERLRAFACVPLQNPRQAAAELERAVKELGSLGALINGFSNIGDENTSQYLDEPQVDVFWEKVEELDVPVYLHPRIPLPNQRRMYKGYDGLLGSAWASALKPLRTSCA
jgi:gamma-resorcylate decarboxylase